MLVIRETEKGVLLERDCVQFWVPKRWLSGFGNGPPDSWKLTPAAIKAYAIAAKKHWSNIGFDALGIFETLRETDRAVLLRCVVELPNANKEERADFWLPKAKTADIEFVKMKVREILERFPFVGARIKGFKV